MHLSGPSGNEQWEPEPALRPCPDKQTPSPAAVHPHTAASHLQNKKKTVQSRDTALIFQSSHGCCVVNRIHISADIESFRTSSQSPEWQLFFSLWSRQVFVSFFSTKSQPVGKLYPLPPPTQFLLQDLFFFFFFLQNANKLTKKDSRGNDSKRCKNRQILPKHIKAYEKRSQLFFHKARNHLVGGTTLGQTCWV